jgi:hypothetical protein
VLQVKDEIGLHLIPVSNVTIKPTLGVWIGMV